MHFLIAVIMTIVALGQPNSSKVYPGFSCITLAHRQALPGAPGMTFKVLKQMYASNFHVVMHRHKFGEIVYLLSGSATEIRNGKSVALSADRAITVPANTYHAIKPGPHGVTVLSVQFTDTTAQGWEPQKKSGVTVCKD